MYNSKKAQISDTMSWMVATIIIVVLLSIPILLVQLKLIGDNGASFARVQDPIATKSISGYLLKNYMVINEIDNTEVSAENLDYSMTPFLISLARYDSEGWNVFINVEDKKVYSKLLHITSTQPPRGVNKFYFQFNKKVMLEFWREGASYFL